MNLTVICVKNDINEKECDTEANRDRDWMNVMVCYVKIIFWFRLNFYIDTVNHQHTAKIIVVFFGQHYQFVISRLTTKINPIEYFVFECIFFSAAIHIGPVKLSFWIPCGGILSVQVIKRWKIKSVLKSV